MKCPFRVNVKVVKKWDPANDKDKQAGIVPSTEKTIYEYADCYGKDCMAYLSESKDELHTPCVKVWAIGQFGEK